MKNKTVLITGATSGIGYELTKLLYLNNTIIAIARNKYKLEKLSNEFRGLIPYQADLSNIDHIENLTDKIIKDFKSIDILINNAAVQFTPKFLDSEFEYKNISTEINTNLTAVCSLSYKLLPLLLHEREAIILNVNSGLGLSPKTTSAVYCATKGGVNIFTQSLRYQLENTNINVQQVFLELVDTKMTKGRGTNKLSPKVVAEKIVYVMEHRILDYDIGKVKLLRVLLRVFPTLAKKIMKKY